MSDTISVPVNIVEDLLAYLDGRDWGGVKAMAAEITRAAEDEEPEKFKTHRDTKAKKKK